MQKQGALGAEMQYNASGMKSLRREDGFTLVELTAAMTVFAVAAISFFALYNSLIQSTVLAKRQAVALTLATNQMEYLKSLPYDSLVVIGGSMGGTPTIPATKTETVNGVQYTITTQIDYVDNAYDNCGTYPTTEIKLRECRSSTTSTPQTDSNRNDYKAAHVTVTDNPSRRLAEVDTQIAAKVAETDSTSGALFVTVIDESGNPIENATVEVRNNTLTPNIFRSTATDSFGLAILYDLPPDNGTDYVVTASKANYSTVSTISSHGSLQPTFPSQRMLTQQASYVTLILKPQGTNSLIIEAVDTNGNPLPGLRVYVKGGYKKYAATDNTEYYYDNLSPSDTRPTIGADGLAVLTDLVPGSYIFCGDTGTTGCRIGTNGTSYNLVAAVPYGGTNPLNPITVPTYLSSSPPSVTFPYNGNPYLQKVRLILSASTNFPRVFTLTPSDVSKATGNISNFEFTITGQMLSCGNGGGCSSNVKFVQGGSEYVAACTGGSGGEELNCTADLSGVNTGPVQLVVGTNNGTIALPTDPLGGLNVQP